ncbi:hypothetical protein, partial [Salmonella enterica]
SSSTAGGLSATAMRAI